MHRCNLGKILVAPLQILVAFATKLVALLSPANSPNERGGPGHAGDPKHTSCSPHGKGMARVGDGRGQDGDLNMTDCV